MRSGIALAGYVPVESWLHRLHPAAKVVLLVVYIVAVAVRPAATYLLALQLCLAAVTVAAHLPLRYAWFNGLVAVLLLLAAAGLPMPALGRQLIVGLGRVANLMLLVALFSMTTKANDLLPAGATGSGRGGWRASTAFAVSLTIAVLPGIQYDLQRALDAATLRRGRPVGPLDLGVWLGLLPHAILRGLARADRLAEAVADRGWGSSATFTRLRTMALKPSDFTIAAAAALPAVALLVGRP